MKQVFLLITILGLIGSCRQGNQQSSGAAKSNQTNREQEKLVFFPVTTFIEGQIFDIKQKGLNPVRIIKKADGTPDSTWIAVESLKTEFSEFLQPVIDSVNMVQWFREKTFLDETIGMVTMTYERKPECPDTFQLREWTVYIDPETDKVKRIYLVKQKADSIRQLTWVADQYCRLITLDEKKSKGSPIVGDLTYSWAF